MIEVASGQTLDAAMKQRLLDPLGMDSTFFHIPEGETHRLATLYKLEDGELQTVTAEDGVQWEGRTPHSASYQLPGRTKYLSGGAGLVSTAGDYLKVLEMLLGEGERDGVRVLEAKTVKQMTQNQIGGLTCGFPIHGDKFGLGVGIHTNASEQKNGASPETFGWAGFFFTYMWADPQRDVAGVLMVQLHPNGGLPLWSEFQQATYDALDAVHSRPEAIGDDDPLRAYREVVRISEGNLEWRVTDPRSEAEGARNFLPNPVLEFEVPSLDGVTEARLTIDRWGGHLGTTDTSIRLNDNKWIVLPPIATLPEENAAEFYAQDSITVAVPLEHLKEGTNTFEGTCRTVGDHNWGQYGPYAIRLRLGVPALDRDVQIVTGSKQLGPAARFRIEAPDAEEVILSAKYRGVDDDGDGGAR